MRLGLRGLVCLDAKHTRRTCGPCVHVCGAKPLDLNVRCSATHSYRMGQLKLYDQPHIGSTCSTWTPLPLDPFACQRPYLPTPAWPSVHRQCPHHSAMVHNTQPCEGLSAQTCMPPICSTNHAVLDLEMPVYILAQYVYSDTH